MMVLSAAAVALLLCGLAQSAPSAPSTPSAAGAGGDRRAGGSNYVVGLQEELSIGAAELAAVPAESRTLFAKVLGRLDGMHGEMEEMHADRARSDARMTNLDESECECGPLADMVNEIHTQMGELQAEIASLKHGRRNERFENTSASGDDGAGGDRRAERRRMQRTGTAGQAKTVNIYTRTLEHTSVGNASAGPVRGRRRAQTAPTARVCNAATLQQRTAAVTARCCDEPGESCDGPNGSPLTCNRDCAGELLTYWDECRYELDKPTHASLHEVVRECQEAIVERSGETLARQLDLSCSNLGVTEECVPACGADLHGDLLLANIDGDDSKFSCEFHHGKFSWIGAASNGGYLGRDARSFLSSLLSGAPGEFICTLDEDAEVHTDVDIQPGMRVQVTGDASLPEPPFWGVGSFSVGERASLSLAYLLLDSAATIAVTAGGSLALTDLALHAAQLIWSQQAGDTLVLSNVDFSGSNVVPEGGPCSGGATYAQGLGPGATVLTTGSQYVRLRS
jgi:hypothetical protein